MVAGGAPRSEGVARHGAARSARLRRVMYVQRRAGSCVVKRCQKDMQGQPSNGLLLTTACAWQQYRCPARAVSALTLPLSGRRRGITQSVQCLEVQGGQYRIAWADLSCLRVELYRASETSLATCCKRDGQQGTHVRACACVPSRSQSGSAGLRSPSHQSEQFTPAPTRACCTPTSTLSTVHKAAGSSVPRASTDAPQNARRRLDRNQKRYWLIVPSRAL